VAVALAPVGVEAKPKPKPKVDDKACRAPFRLERKNSVLQRNLEKALAAQGWGGYINKGQLAVAVVDLTDSNHVFYAGVNDDKMLYAASLPKIAILLTVVQEVEDGHLKWTHEFDERLQNMVTASSNPDASWATDLVGLLAIEKTMRDPRYCFYEEPNGGLWLGRAYRRGGATNRDPLFNISHGATARQAARYYGMLDRGMLVNPHWSFRMLGLMSPPAHHHKFVGGLAKREGVVFLARKSGTWSVFHADSALIKHFDNRYVIVGLAETSKGEQIMRSLALVVDDLILDGQHRRRGQRRSVVHR
jgi:beta-lactamase class A